MAVGYTLNEVDIDDLQWILEEGGCHPPTLVEAVALSCGVLPVALLGWQ